MQHSWAPFPCDEGLHVCAPSSSPCAAMASRPLAGSGSWGDRNGTSGLGSSLPARLQREGEIQATVVR